MKIKHLDSAFELKTLKDDGTFSGYGSVFGVEDSYGDVVEPGAFENSLKAHAEKGTMPALLWQHDAKEPIGLYKNMREDKRGLFVEGQLLIDDDPLARRAYAHLKAGSVSGLSIGYMVKEESFDKDEKINYLKEVDLWETSIVTFPANDSARISVVKAINEGEIPDIRELENAVRDAFGFSAREAKRLLADGYKGLAERRDVDEESLTELAASIKRVAEMFKK